MLGVVGAMMERLLRRRSILTVTVLMAALTQCCLQVGAFSVHLDEGNSREHTATQDIEASLFQFEKRQDRIYKRQKSSNKQATCTCTCETKPVFVNEVLDKGVLSQSTQTDETELSDQPDNQIPNDVEDLNSQVRNDERFNVNKEAVNEVAESDPIDRYQGGWGHGSRYPWKRLPDNMCYREPCQSDKNCCLRFNICDRSAKVCVDCWYGSTCTSERDCCYKYPRCQRPTGGRADADSSSGRCVDK